MAEQQQFSPVSPSRPPLPVQLTEERHAIREELRGTQPRLAAMYEGALLLLHMFDHQEKLPLAAHLLRELIEKLPEEKISEKFGANIRKPDISPVFVAWGAVLSADGDTHTHDNYSEQMCQFIRAWRVHYTQSEQFGLNRRKQTDKFVGTLAPTPDSGPSTQRKLHVELWMNTRRFFTQVSHHRECTETEFMRWLETLELFLSNWFVGGTFRKFDDIDRLIKEGEADAE